MDASGNGWVSDAIRCWDYCMLKDAHVISNSWGGVDFSQALQARAAPACSGCVLLSLPYLARGSADLGWQSANFWRCRRSWYHIGRPL